MGSLCVGVCGCFGIRFLLFVLEVLTIAKLDHQLNEEIRDKEIRLIGADGAQLGIVSAAQANAMAEEQGMDLVKISPNAVPPVCKIMDYSKFCYDQKIQAVADKLGEALNLAFGENKRKNMKAPQTRSGV